MSHTGFMYVRELPVLEKLKEKMWNSENFDTKVSEQISENYKKLQRTRVIVTMFTMITYMLCFPLSRDFREFQMFLYCIDEDGIVYKTIHILMVLIAMSHIIYFSFLFNNLVFLFAFTMTDMKSHIFMIRRKLELISLTYDEKPNISNCWYYQKYVHETLAECISQHVLLLR